MENEVIEINSIHYYIDGFSIYVKHLASARRNIKSFIKQIEQLKLNPPYLAGKPGEPILDCYKEVPIASLLQYEVGYLEALKNINYSGLQTRCNELHNVEEIKDELIQYKAYLFELWDEYHNKKSDTKLETYFNDGYLHALEDILDGTEIPIPSN